MLDENIHASSQKSEDTRPQMARLDSDGAWIPDPEDDDMPFIQIDLTWWDWSSAVVTLGHPRENKYVTEFMVAHSMDGSEWDFAIPLGANDSDPVSSKAHFLYCYLISLNMNNILITYQN